MKHPCLNVHCLIPYRSGAGWVGSRRAASPYGISGGPAAPTSRVVCGSRSGYSSGCAVVGRSRSDMGPWSATVGRSS